MRLAVVVECDPDTLERLLHLLFAIESQCVPGQDYTVVSADWPAGAYRDTHFLVLKDEKVTAA